MRETRVHGHPFRAPALLLLAGLIGSAPLHSQETRDSKIDFFEKKIRPVLAERCYECHSAEAKKLKGGLRLDTREGLLRVAPPGDLERGALIRAIRWAEEDLRMPPKQKLPAAVVADVEAWIRTGSVVPSPKGPRADGQHWAFVPPKEISVPGDGRHPIDAFISARLAAKGLVLSEPADPRTLLRRVTYDLTGLPPDVGEIDAFLADPSEQAYEKVVDRLLASPRYGERWARHWLDVARYADTTDGNVNANSDSRLLHSAHYRDWVIGALNEDLPYDRFVLEQLAADLLPAEDRRRPLEALGFLTLGRRFNDNVHDIIDDRLDVVGRGLLGLTLSCARCHDHKFDPIPTADYYSLYGVFAASKEKVLPLAGSAPATEEHRRELQRRKDELRAFIRARGTELQEHVRSKVEEYLVAAAGGSSEGLNALIVAHWREYVASMRSPVHPVFGAWHALTGGNLKDVSPQLHPAVAAAFDPAPASLVEAARKLGKLIREAGTDEVLRGVLHGPKALPLLRGDPSSVGEHFYDLTVGYEIASFKTKISRWETAGPGAPARALAFEDTTPKKDPRVFKRGSPDNPGESVPRRFLAALSSGERAPFVQGSGRLELARAIVRPENPLTARVLVNRVWLHHFGAGIVKTPSDFGAQSEPPSHPELLDWLAQRFVAQGWSLKKLHRMILLSSTYRQSSADGPARKVDPENRLLWRQNPRRLDFEAMRDSLLAVSGSLDPALGGPSEMLTSQPYSRRRSVYGFVDRLNLSNVLMSFDFANPTNHVPQRHFTTVPQQALFLMNSAFMIDQARKLTARPEIASTTDGAEKIRVMYRRVYGRAPTNGEIRAGLRFVKDAGKEAPAPPPPVWSYGYGGVDEATGRLASFRELPCYTGEAWQGSPYLPDPHLGGLLVDATGGNPGEDAQHAAVRRWTSPRDGAVSIRGAVKLLFDADTYHGAIRVRIISSRSGTVADKIVGPGEVPLGVDRLDVARGDTIDFVADCHGYVSYDRFSWAPTLRMGDQSWSAEAEFAGPQEAPLTVWEKYAQVLLETNEFLFVD
jgi:hypothetical protein